MAGLGISHIRLSVSKPFWEQFLETQEEITVILEYRLSWWLVNGTSNGWQCSSHLSAK